MELAPEQLDEVEIPADLQVTGYDVADRFLASRYRQGGWWVYNIDLSLTQIASYLRKPDPEHPTEDNRKIRVSHADGFGKYIRRNEHWVAPALLLRAPSNVLDFQQLKSVGGIEWGILSVPRLARTDLHIVDGQHRILGIHLALEQLASDLDAARAHLARAQSQGEPSVTQAAKVKVKKFEDERRRLNDERMALQILIIDDPVEYKQVFVDIADNALGITSAIKVRFDSRKVVNRCLSDVIEHALLRGLVDMQQDRLLGANPNLLGARQVADIIRTLEVGPSGRISARLENELRERDLVKQAERFFDTLIGSFPQLADIAEGTAGVPQLRETSILGSTTFLRVLAGTYHILVREQERQPEEVAAFFAKLAPFLSAPAGPEGPWAGTGFFSEPWMAPSARRQDVEGLARTIAEWASNPPAWLGG